MFMNRTDLPGTLKCSYTRIGNTNPKMLEAYRGLTAAQGANGALIAMAVAVAVATTLSMSLYPGMARLLQLDDVATGIFLGGTIHDVAQVVGAGLMISHGAADPAIVVKLFRVPLLVPVVAGLAWFWRRRSVEATYSSCV